MGLIEYYLLFAVSISLASCYFWYWPTVREAQQKGIKNSFTEMRVTSLVIYFLLTCIIAPLILLPMLSNTMAEHYVVGIKREILRPYSE